VKNTNRVAATPAITRLPVLSSARIMGVFIRVRL
jgi:hypothetical protein